MIYNRKRYIKLLQYEQDLKNQGKSLSDENKDEDFELLKYKASISSYISWKNRTQFLLLMEKFVNKTISGEEFNDDFFELRQRMKNEYECFHKELCSDKFKDFQIDPRSTGFGSLISFLRAECDNFTEDYQNEEFYNSIKDCFLKLQEAVNEGW